MSRVFRREENQVEYDVKLTKSRDSRGSLDVTIEPGIQTPHLVDVMRRDPHFAVAGSYCTATARRPESSDHLVRLRVNDG